MGNQRHRPVIVRAVFLDKKGQRATGRMVYALLILDEEGQIVARPATAATIREIVRFAKLHVKAAGLGRVGFEPSSDEVDWSAGKAPRRYETLELSEIYYASPALGQS